MRYIKLISTTLQQILTRKRLFLLVLFGTLSGLLMARIFPSGSPWYAGALYALIGIACVMLAFWLAPLRAKR
jgi:uncharacterized membrane protein YuzA (DUF378 family)